MSYSTDMKIQDQVMKWRPLKEALATLKIPADYLLERLNREEIPTVINLLKEWYPDVVVGSESCHLSPAFYEQEVYFSDSSDDKPIFALTFKNHYPSLAG